MKNVKVGTAVVLVASIGALVALEWLKVRGAGIAAVGIVSTVVAGLAPSLFKDVK